MITYIFTDTAGGQKTIQADFDRDAIERAKEWVAEGDFGDVNETLWASARVREACPLCWGVGKHADDCKRSNEGLLDRVVRAAVEPLAPPCSGKEGHEWSSDFIVPSVRAHGGGIILTECCMHCGCARITDTWAQDLSTGKEGLRSTRYEPGRFIAALRALDRGVSES